MYITMTFHGCFILMIVSLQCRLHIHASYSTTMKMNVPMLPLSQPNAVGLILAHGKKKKKIASFLVLPKVPLNGSNCSCLSLQEVLETRNQFSPLMCMCLTTVATRGCWPSRAPIITLYWTLEGCWWPWNTPAPLSIRSSEFTLVFKSPSGLKSLFA